MSDFPDGWLRDELDATKADIEKMSESERHSLEIAVVGLISFLQNLGKDDD